MPSVLFSAIADKLPLVPAPASLRVSSRQRTKTSQAESGRILSRAYGGQYFEVTLSYNPMTREQAGPLLAFLQSREGRNSIFKVELSGFADVPGFKIGNFANFDNDTKLHLITGSGSNSVTPPPREPDGNPAGNPITDKVYMRASLTNDAQVVELGRNGLIRLDVDLVERLL
jgi:hypothetical protein